MCCSVAARQNIGHLDKEETPRLLNKMQMVSNKSQMGSFKSDGACFYISIKWYSGEFGSEYHRFTREKRRK